QYFLVFPCTETGPGNVDDRIGAADSSGEIFILFRNDYISCPKHSQCFSSVLSFRNSHVFMPFCSKQLENILLYTFTASKTKYLHPIPTPFNTFISSVSLFSLVETLQEKNNC